MNALVLQEYDAKVWNCTDDKSFFGIEISKNNLPDDKNPALVNPNSPEITGRYKGVDFGATTCDGLVLSPILLNFFVKFSNPLFDEKTFKEERMQEDHKSITLSSHEAETSSSSTTTGVEGSISIPPDRLCSVPSSMPTQKNIESTENGGEGIFFNQLQALREETKNRLDEIDNQIDQLDKDAN